MPSGKVAKPDITDNKDGTVTVKYAPTEAGLHEMDIKYDGIHIPGKTYFCTVYCDEIKSDNKFPSTVHSSKVCHSKDK